MYFFNASGLNTIFQAFLIRHKWYRISLRLIYHLHDVIILPRPGKFNEIPDFHNPDIIKVDNADFASSAWQPIDDSIAFINQLIPIIVKNRIVLFN